VVPRVLVVQRDLDIDGIEQAVAPDGDTAVALLDTEQFDAVVLDLDLPPLDGWCVLARIAGRQDRPPVIAYAAERADAERARRLGAGLSCTDWSAIGARIHDTLCVRSTRAG
jgi:DNA-binding response OmpR family regulator